MVVRSTRINDLDSDVPFILCSVDLIDFINFLRLGFGDFRFDFTEELTFSSENVADEHYTKRAVNH